MTNRKVRWTLRGLLAFVLVVGALGCSPMEEAASYWINGVIAITSQEQCVARSDARSMRVRGYLDTWMTNRYELFVKVQNYLLSTRAEFGKLYGENHNIQVLGAHVSFSYPTGLDPATVKMLSDTYFVPGTGSIAPASAGVAFIVGIPPEVGNALATDSVVRASGIGIQLNVRIEGRLGDGTIVRSNEYYYPIDVCYGCLYQRVSLDPNDLSDATDMRPPCKIGQDDGVDSRLLVLLGYDLSEIGH